MPGGDAAAELLTVVTFALDCVLSNDYKEEFDADGNLAALELRPGMSEECINVPFLEQYFRKVLSPHKSEALFSLKHRRTPEEIEEVFRLIFPPERALEAAIELAGANWEEILRFLNRQFEIHRQIGKREGELVVREREGFSSPFGAEVEALIEQQGADYLDEFSARTYIGQLRGLLPNVIKRARALRLLSVLSTVPADLQTYMVEASRCYLYGHFLASLVLCRSAIEFAVKERLREKLDDRSASEVDDLPLAGLLREARERGLLDDARRKLADEIRELAVSAVHHKEKLPIAEECKDAFIKTRGILEHLYG